VTSHVPRGRLKIDKGLLGPIPEAGTEYTSEMQPWWTIRAETDSEAGGQREDVDLSSDGQIGLQSQKSLGLKTERHRTIE